MSRTGGRLLLVLGLLVAAALVIWALDAEEGGDGFALEDDEALRTPPPESGQNRRPADVRRATPRPPRGDGVPRVLPPDAAIEDVRDALAAEEAVRAREVQAAYAAITRIAQDGGDILRGLQRYLEEVENPVTRGIVLAALGSNRDAHNLAWLARRLENGPDDVDRLGAFLGLACDPDSKTTSRVVALANIEHPLGSLPTARLVLAQVAAWLERATGEVARDSAAALTYSVERDAQVAALLIVDGERMCRLYGALDEARRERLRAALRKHAALWSAHRKVIEAAR